MNLGSPALLMIQSCKPAQHTLFSLGFSVVVNWRGTVIIKSAGEPVSGFSRTFDDSGLQTCAAYLVFPGILGRCELERHSHHQKCGRTRFPDRYQTQPST